MKGFSFSIYNIVALLFVVGLIVLILSPFNPINMEQAERIAKWKSVYEELNYSFELVKLYENTIISEESEEKEESVKDRVVSNLITYFNLKSSDTVKPYKYRKMNGQTVKKNNEFYFDEFYQRKDNVILSIKENPEYKNIKNNPMYYLFVDINGNKKPNKTGLDIFIMNIYKDKVSALGQGKSNTELKADCSPIGTGLFCSQYYLLGGRF